MQLQLGQPDYESTKEIFFGHDWPHAIFTDDDEKVSSGRWRGYEEQNGCREDSYHRCQNIIRRELAQRLFDTQNNKKTPPLNDGVSESGFAGTRTPNLAIMSRSL